MTHLQLLPQPLIKLYIWRSKGYFGAYLDNIKIGVAQIQVLDDFEQEQCISFEDPLQIADIQVQMRIPELRKGVRLRVTYSKNQQGMYALVDLNPSAEIILLSQGENKFSLETKEGFDLKLSGMKIVKSRSLRPKRVCRKS